MTPTVDPASFDPIEATIADLHTAIDGGDLTVASLVERYLARIDAYDDAMNAILTVNDDAMTRAETLDTRFEAEGFVGPLHGVPIVVKDNHDTHDMPTTVGCEALSEVIPPRDAVVVDRLRAAGAVVIAKTNLQEFAFGVDTISSLGGETRNAYALDRRPAGSSGGTAAAVAGNLALAGTGSDTCSSIRSPPAFNALVGIRPTRGLVSRTGIVPLSETQDTAGPIARTVADAARLLEVMAGYDPDDPVTATGVDRIPEDGYVAHLEDAELEGSRIGVIRSLFEPRDRANVPDDGVDRIVDVLESAIDAMAAAGATIVDPVEIMERRSIAAARVVTLEFKRDFDRYLAGLGDEAPYGSLEAIVESGRVAPAVAARIRESGALEVDAGSVDDDPAYLRRLNRRRRIRVDTLRRMADHRLDALVYPPSTVLPVRLPAHQPFEEMNCELAAHTGLPAVVVPAGFTSDGLPVGLEMLGRPFAERRLVRLAHAFERATGHRRPPDGFGTLG